MACVAPVHPSQKEDEEDLAAFELPFFQRLVVQLWAMVLGLISRLTDAVLLVGRPALVRPYVGLWLAERLRSPYRARRSFEVVLALRATGQRMRELIYGETPLMSALWVFRRAGVGPGSRLV
ncbi:MAG TPA: class I SAM-dependent methyltransferase, partial [Archangium sp.]|nr:class I SAM-dependent methyltransferase [Archangium sp.]